MKIAILTLGCKTNQAESMHMEYALNKEGYHVVGISEKPDVCIINTCAVTSKADYQSRQLIHRALKNKSKVIVTGCYTELNQGQIKKIDNNIEVIRNTEKDNIIKLIKANNPNKTLSKNHTAFLRQRAIVKVQDGCNYSCSYCTIPFARGKSRSIPINEVIKEINLYEKMGYKEVVITGIHLGTYGIDLKPIASLSLLLKNILINTNIQRIRISSLEIGEVTDELLELISENRVCKHLHLPIQSGDNNILKLMNRTYSVENFISKIDKIFVKIPDISIGTDVIVGFPCEGEAEFNNTVNIIKSIPFSYIHVFPYSPRPGTKAATLSGYVKDSIKKERVRILRQIGLAKKRLFIERNIGKRHSIILENRHKDSFIGTSDNYLKVFLRGTTDLKEGMLVSCIITGYEDDIAEGVLDNSLQPFNN